MIFYTAGFGHRIEKTEFINQIDNHLLSYYYIINGGMLKSRFEHLKSVKKELIENEDNQKDGSNKRIRKRKKRSSRKRNN